MMRRALVALVMLVFFVIALLTNALGTLVPEVIRSFRLSLTEAAVLPFCFFIAYGVMSVPAGMLRDRYSEKPVMAAAFAAALAGCLAFALHPVYWMAAPCLFLVGAGMAVLQVAINPLLRVAGGEEHFAFHSAMAQLVFGMASFLGPHLYAALVGSARVRALAPPGLAWISVYWVFAAVALAMLLLIAAAPFPPVARTAGEQTGSWTAYASLLRNRTVLLYFGATFAYVGSEQGVANWISQFLSVYHGADPRTTGAAVVAGYWGLMTAGCAVGMVLLKLFDSRRVLIAFSTGALLALTVALFGPARWALAGFPLIGLCASVMWPVIISLGLNSVTALHGSAAGLLCTGIVGGALVPFAIGRVGDWAGLRTGMCLLYLSFGCVLSVGFWARPVIGNAIAGRRR